MSAAAPRLGSGNEDRALDVEVAIRLERYRWVCWPRDGHGRFLAPPDHLLFHLWAPAPISGPLAEQPFRYLPSYSRDVSAAFRACERCGLFRSGAACLTRSDDGSWRIVLRAQDMDLRDELLPRLLCRAALAWARAQAAQELES